MIEELNKSITSTSSEIKGLLHQTTSLDKALSQLANNQATLLSMSARKL
jgi:prefoldin subunit 5